MDEFKVPSNIPKFSTKNDNLGSKENQIDIKSNEIEVKSKNQAKPILQCPYKEPKWSNTPEEDIEYKFEVLKSGAIVEEIKNLQEKPYWLFGRLPENDIVMAHPTISRYHAVLQYRPKTATEGIDETSECSFQSGWYIYDIESTHGTFLNKMRIPSRTYVRIKVGHMLKLGASTRNFILQGPDFDEEPETEETITELKYKRMQVEEEKRLSAEMQEEMREKEGISWGMPEDADEETDLNVNPYASTNNELLFLDDPKKTLRGFFEREGLDLEYKCDEMSPGTYVCRIELPIADAMGKFITAEVCHKGKKKECVVQCALEACRILDRHGVLRQANHEPLRKKINNKDSDDEDDFLDRTGDVARKKHRKENVSQKAALGYNELVEQEKCILLEISKINESICMYHENSKQIKENVNSSGEDLEDFMEHLTEKTISIDRTEIRRLRFEQQRLNSELENLQKLIKIAKPIDILLPTTTIEKNTNDTKKKFSLPLFGKRNKYKFMVAEPIKKMKLMTSNENSELQIEVEEEVVEENNGNDSATKDRYDDVDNLRNTNVENSSSKISDDTRQEIIAKKELIEKQHNVIEDSSCNAPKDEANKTKDVDNESKDEANKKRHHRIRNRSLKRENVDIDDSAEFESADKHSEWLPPANQRGDGMTNLNEKFGY